VGPDGKWGGGGQVTLGWGQEITNLGFYQAFGGRLVETRNTVCTLQ
jgi:hypothetical protein